jgi:ribosomal-protein-alanine N-acetyltransferase
LGPGEAQLLNLTVVGTLRRRGIGRELLRRFLLRATELGADQCFLEVRASNSAAISLYSAEGFVPVARRAGYYPASDPGEVREDALVLRRALRDR